SAHLEKCGTVEGRGASARSERIEWVAPQTLGRLAVRVVEAMEGPVDDDARRVDPSLVSETDEHRCRHDDSLPGVEHLDETLQEGRRAHDVVVEQDHGRVTRCGD